MKLCTNGMENVQVETYTLMEPSSRISYGDCKTTRKRRVNWFTASNGWREKWKHIYGVREKRLCREVNEVSTTTVMAWIEWLPELCQNYESQNILNLDELGLFFKIFPKKGLIEKRKKTKVGKKSKQRTAVACYCCCFWWLFRFWTNCYLEIKNAFPIKKLGLSQTSWRVLCWDSPVKCA